MGQPRHHPRVMFAMADDPVKLEFVGSLSRPGGNIAGVTLLVSELARSGSSKGV